MKAFRIVRPEFNTPAEAFSGKGGLYVEGRWHNKGQLVVYASEHLSLAMLENIVHLKSPKSLSGYIWYSIEIPDEWIETPEKLPAFWHEPTHSRISTESGSIYADVPQKTSQIATESVTPAYHEIDKGIPREIKSTLKLIKHKIAESLPSEFGALWLEEKRSVGLVVPSAILPEEHNVIINPTHENYNIGMVRGPFPLTWDGRLA